MLAHVACRLDVAMAANVVAVESPSPLVVSRQVLGGSALEEMPLAERRSRCSPSRGTPATRPRPRRAPRPSYTPWTWRSSDADLRARVVRTEAGEPDESGDLTRPGSWSVPAVAPVAPTGSRDLLELAELLDGALGVSRVVTSLGWRPHHEQVGQTGSRVSPDLYVACGISGAIQHWAGMSSSKTILAINTDPDAPMVTKAHYAVIGDLHEIVPAINEELRRRANG